MFPSTDEYDTHAKYILPKSVYDFYRGGSGNELCIQRNKTAFKNIKIRPRVLRNVSKRSMACNIMGLELNTPIAIAPMSLQKLAHPDGELATAKAAASTNTLFTLSTMSTVSIEEIADGTPNSLKWFQLYVFKDRHQAGLLVRRAEASGFKALVLTVDLPVMGIRRDDIRNDFKLPPHIEIANFKKEIEIVKLQQKSLTDYFSSLYDSCLTWDDVEWLVNFTKLPVILKGILTKEDAILAAKTGCKGIIVSNHGGRQLDDVQATIDVLSDVVNAVGDKLTVMMDGGVCDGMDVFKAIALGAKLVFIGRPILWGLTVNGQNGVENVIRLYEKELDNTMALAGVKNINEINSNYLYVPSSKL